MLTAHRTFALLAIAGCLVASGAGLLAYRRRRAGAFVAHLLALAQTLLVAQVGLGLLLLSDDRRAPEQLHYAYGVFALLAALAPWLYAPADPRRRLLWFAGSTFVAAALAVRAYTTA
jgi:hypothetical protein